MAIASATWSAGWSHWAQVRRPITRSHRHEAPRSPRAATRESDRAASRAQPATAGLSHLLRKERPPSGNAAASRGAIVARAECPHVSSDQPLGNLIRHVLSYSLRIAAPITAGSRRRRSGRAASETSPPTLRQPTRGSPSPLTTSVISPRRARSPASPQTVPNRPDAPRSHGCRQDRYSSAERAKGRLVDPRRVCLENLRDDLPSSTIVSPGLAVHIRSSRCFSCTEAPMNRSAITGCGDMFDSAALRTGGGPTARHKAACWICGSDRRGRPLAAPIILGRGTANAHGACEPKHAFLTD